MKPRLGVCYYPEHWPRETWADDARRMAEAGIGIVRIGEFAWSRVEPAPDEFDWQWLDQAIDTLAAAGLEIVLGTPTATPPRWMLQRHPDMLALDAEGRERRFGSRRHYCFSHPGYRAECARIVEAFAHRYGNNPHVRYWQTDNEYGCHATTVSYSDAARVAFRAWLAARYGDIDALNRAWGNVFWSMEYADFADIDPPNLTVTEANPAHRLAFLRFSSDQVVSFNRLQVDILRRYGDQPIAHNYMGGVTDFDHFAVGADLDIASWDSYPLGFLEDRIIADDAHKRRFARQGDPDYQAFHHDLYRAVGRGRWWVMEQQPGPVNWAPVNPAPAPGMVRLWTWEAFAHGAEAVCYFRWRQVPFAQEQMHAGLLRPDSEPAPGLAEARAVADEIGAGAALEAAPAPVALLFDYDADWAWRIQPHARGAAYPQLAYEFYRALRALGQSIDILPPSATDFTGYALVVAPGLMHMPESLKTALADSGARVWLGPRSAARDRDFAITAPLPPAIPGLDARVTRVESLRADMPQAVAGGGAVLHYREWLEGAAEVVASYADGESLALRAGLLTYLGGWPDRELLARLLGDACREAGLATIELPDGVRVRDTATERFWFNYELEPRRVGGRELPAVSVTREPLSRG